MPNFAGFVNPIGRSPTFLIPLFREYAASNELLVQRITECDTVAAFELFDDLRGFDCPVGLPTNLSVKIDGPALWAFAFSSNDWLFGTAHEIRPELERRLRSGQLTGFPLLETEVADFCGADDVRERALITAFEALGGQSSLGAGIWRDVVVLRRAACSHFCTQSNERGWKLTSADFDAIRVESKDGVARIEVPSRLLGLSLSLVGERVSPVQKLASVFALKITYKAISVKAPPENDLYPTDLQPLDYRLAEFSGPSLVGPKSKPSATTDGYRHTRVGPFGAVNDFVRQKRAGTAIGRFAVFRNSREHLNELSHPDRLNVDGEELIGIVVQRVGFGSTRGSTIRASDLIQRIYGAADFAESMRSPINPQSLFFVGGHVLQRSLGFAPDSRAMQEGNALAISSASAIMALTHASGAESFGKVPQLARSRGIGLALRRALKRDESPVDGLRLLLKRLLHPEARVANSSEVSITISPALHGSKNALVEELEISLGVDRKITDILELPKHRGPQQISLVATNVPFERPTLDIFRQFCQKLLAALDWLVDDRWAEAGFPGILASRSGVSVLFMQLLNPHQVHLVAGDALKNEGSGPQVRCILTDFTPDAGTRQAASAADFAIVHYSRINEWFDFEIIGRKQPFGRTGQLRPLTH